jgi:hypothetical protein
MMWRKLGSTNCVKLISILMPELVRRLICWLVTAEDLLTTISPRQGCWFQWNTGLQTGVRVKCRIVSFNFFVLEVVSIWWRVCTACGFVRLHEFGWIGDKGNVIVCWLSFSPFVLLAFMLLLNCIAVPECKCKQCGCVRRKMNNASTTRMY